MRKILCIFLTEYAHYAPCISTQIWSTLSRAHGEVKTWTKTKPELTYCQSVTSTWAGLAVNLQFTEHVTVLLWALLNVCFYNFSWAHLSAGYCRAFESC